MECYSLSGIPSGPFTGTRLIASTRQPVAQENIHIAQSPREQTKLALGVRFPVYETSLINQPSELQDVERSILAVKSNLTSVYVCWSWGISSDTMSEISKDVMGSHPHA